MDPQFAFASREDLWRLQNDMKTVYSTQAEHADRILRLERRQDEDTRLKSVWGGSSFPSALSGTSQQDASYNPAAEAFKSFDQDQSSNLLGSLHLETEEEPRRGASRANSVRFDESALHGHLSHTSRSSSEIFPIRTGSGFGSHPMTERSSSHKSDGRQSSGGQSTHSTRLNSLANDPRPSGIISAVPADAAPGLFLLGPLPSIIRCWLDTRFSNDSLLYAAICTGSFRSSLSRRLVEALGLVNHTSQINDRGWIKLAVYFPEATLQQSSIRPASPAPQLPVLTVTFQIVEADEADESIEVFLGSDILRTNNADILFSQSRMTIYDDHHNKLAVPLVRPEKVAVFEKLATRNARTDFNKKADHDSQNLRFGVSSDVLRTSMAHTSSPASQSEPKRSIERTESRSLARATETQGATEKVESTNIIDQQEDLAALPENVTHGTFAISPTKSNPNGAWTTWRRDATHSHTPEATFSSAASISSFSQATKGKGMKVLRPARLSTSRSVSATQNSLGLDVSSSSWAETRKVYKSGDAQDHISPSPTDSFKGPITSDLKQNTQAINVAARTSNPVGGASAFGWLNTAQRKHSSTST